MLFLLAPLSFMRGSRAEEGINSHNSIMVLSPKQDAMKCKYLKEKLNIILRTLHNCENQTGSQSLK